MEMRGKKRIAGVAIALTIAFAVLLAPAPTSKGSDHGDGPLASNSRSADIGDSYMFLDPNDNTKLIVLGTVQGFIVPSEASNFGIFDPNLRYRFEFETSGDAIPDKFLTVSFSPKVSTTAAQMATLTLPNGRTFKAPATLANLSPTSPTPVITTDATSGVSFFAGVVDDPFFFDAVGFSRFADSARAGAADPTQLQRGRDSFAGYATLGMAFSIPLSLLPVTASDGRIGLNFRTQHTLGAGSLARFFTNIDRVGNPGVNVLLIPLARRDTFNLSNPIDDANGRFANDLVTSLTALGTNQANIAILASLAITKGDYLRINPTITNTGNGGGTNTGAGFPNGRRPSDDVSAVFISVVTNGAITTGTNVPANDVPFRNAFPFFAPAPQPFPAGTIDDRTRN